MLSKIRNASSVRNSSATRIAGFMSGRVTRTNRCQAVAPSTLAAFCRSSGHQREAGHQQQGHERGGLPHLGQDDDGDGLPLVGERSGVAEERRQVAGAGRPGVLPAEGGDDGDDAVRDAGSTCGPVPRPKIVRCMTMARPMPEHQLDGHRDDRDDHACSRRRPTSTASVSTDP